MITVLTATEPVTFENYSSVVFLAGSIEMDKASNWQKAVIERLSARFHDPSLLVLNPRRSAWNVSLEQTRNNPEFKAQVDWELNGISAANVVFFYFDPDTKSPISLLELGLVLGMGQSQVIVVCPPEFYRHGNVKITCEDHNDVKVYDDLDSGLEKLISHLNGVHL